MKLSFKRGSALAAAAVVVLLGGCDTENDPAVKNPMIQASVDLDKAYVPSLFYSNINPVPNEPFALNAKATFDTLTGSWSGFKDTIGTTSGSLDLTPYYGEVEGNVTVATTLIDNIIAAGTLYPADITDAHNALESVRDILAEMRGEVPLNYFMDGVTTAHHAMEPVAGAASTYEPGDDDAAYCTALEASLPAFSSAWSDVDSDYSESSIASLYSLGSEKSGNLTANVNAMSAILANLDGNMTDCTANIVAVDTEADKIKGTFVKTFLAFGDFITPFMADMIDMEKAFVPVLYCTNNPPDVNTTCGGLLGTESLINTFIIKMESLQARYPVIPGKLDLPGTIYWKNDFTAINTAMANTVGIMLAAGSTADLIPAHTELEDVRSAMYHLRNTFENYDFITDRVTDYHNAMEPIAIAVKGLAAEDVNQSVKDAISAALPGALTAMRTLERDVPNLDLAAFGLDETWLLTQNISIAAQLTNLQLLQTALDNDIAADILLHAQAVKPGFIPFFKAFGDFILPPT